ncbi:hypothetical protein GCM10023340_32210 [Nocardioides marinquilinus]|uniref:Trehalose O-mycolyltransferase n=1 Tax=Nocardioides marinquilinus TaxID=1210400 RepID=A0ABP9PVE8_9ACTN
MPNERRVSRRAVLTGAGVTGSAVVVGGVGVWEGVLPGRPWLQEVLGLNGEDGDVPDVETGPVESGAFESAARLGETTRWHLLLPPGAAGPEGLPLVVALHGLGMQVDTFLPGGLGVAEWLAAVVDDGTPPFAVVAPEGGDDYWHPRPDGRDPGAMVVDELLPLMAERGLRATSSDRIGLLGWSMGGYGALRLGGLLGPDRVAAVCAASPALWTDPDAASRDGFEDAEEYETFSVFGRQAQLDGVLVRLECGTGDPFYRAVEDYADGFPGDLDPAPQVELEPGGHDRGYWRRLMPGQLRLLGDVVSRS